MNEHANDTPTPKALPLDPALTETTNIVQPVEDMPLKGSLGLAAKPESALHVLYTLDEKLQDVKDNPEQLTPAVLTGEQTVAASTNEYENGEKRQEENQEENEKEPVQVAEPALANPPNVYEQVVDGPKLKVKRSMNFGAPLGSLKPPLS